MLTTKTQTKRGSGLPPAVKKSTSLVRNDIATWKRSLQEAYRLHSPKRTQYYKLCQDVMLDALLTSQIENRTQNTLSAPFVLKNTKGEEDKEVTALFKKSRWYYDLTKFIVETNWYGHSLVELELYKGVLSVSLIPRTHVVADYARFYPDLDSDNCVYYQELKEYGKWILEFGDPLDMGLLNNAIPHILMKKFAQSCWSELCEICGIPPRYLKTNTQDPAMLSRAESMMRDFGAAAWFIIDETENFEFANTLNGNGDVYNNLINLCDNQNSLLISGAVIGQDTKNGNESKELASIAMLHNLINADKRNVESYYNTVIIPALVAIGIIPEGLTFEFSAQEDTSKLWAMVVDLLPHKEVSSEWIKDKFGIEVSDKITMERNNLSLDSFFA